MMEQFNSMPVDQLQAILAQVSRTASLLADVWNNKTLHGLITAAWEIQLEPQNRSDEFPENTKVQHLQFMLNVDDGPVFDEFLQFIHNYCTALCAQKHLLQALIDQKKSEIVNP